MNMGPIWCALTLRIIILNVRRNQLDPILINFPLYPRIFFFFSSDERKVIELCSRLYNNFYCLTVNFPIWRGIFDNQRKGNNLVQTNVFARNFGVKAAISKCKNCCWKHWSWWDNLCLDLCNIRRLLFVIICNFISSYAFIPPRSIVSISWI